MLLSTPARKGIFKIKNMNPIIKYFQDSRQELKKVSWPSKEETTNSTILVIAVSLGVASFLGAIDYGLNRLLEFLLQTF